MSKNYSLELATAVIESVLGRINLRSGARMAPATRRLSCRQRWEFKPWQRTESRRLPSNWLEKEWLHARQPYDPLANAPTARYYASTPAFTRSADFPRWQSTAVYINPPRSTNTCTWTAYDVGLCGNWYTTLYGWVVAFGTAGMVGWGSYHLCSSLMY